MVFICWQNYLTNLFRKARKCLEKKQFLSVRKDEVSYLLESLPCLRASAVILLGRANKETQSLHIS